MKFKLFIIRRTKGIFLKLQLHKIFNPAFFYNLAYLARLSKWRKSIKAPEYNDFYTNHFISERREKLFDYILNKEHLDSEIYYIEFGVAFGKSFKWWLSHNKNKNAKFFGFDTFDGLPEDWNLFKKGEMTTAGMMPLINDDRHEFLKGLFQDTLPKFLKNFKSDKRILLHLDADLYSSTLFALTMMAPYLKKDDIILFDEYNVPTHEFKAFEDFRTSYYVDYEPIAASNNYYQFAVKLKKNVL